MNDTREHIEVTLAERDTPSEAELHELLDRLGHPDEIVSDWLTDEPGAAVKPSIARRAARLLRRTGIPPKELVTVLLLCLGGLAVGVGWIVGLVLLWTSTRWTLSDKLLGTFVAPGGMALAWLFYSNAYQPSAALVVLVASLATTAHLSIRAREVADSSR